MVFILIYIRSRPSVIKTKNKKIKNLWPRNWKGKSLHLFNSRHDQACNMFRRILFVFTKLFWVKITFQKCQICWSVKCLGLFLQKSDILESSPATANPPSAPPPWPALAAPISTIFTLIFPPSLTHLNTHTSEFPLPLRNKI